jgi:signal transduction histidine kinase
VLVVVTVGCLVATVPFVAVLEQGSLDGDLGEWLVSCFAPGFLVSGWWLVRRRPALVLGWLFLFAGVSVAIAGLAAAYAGAAAVEGWVGVDWGVWVFSWLWQPHAALISIAVLAFPDGRFEGLWRRGLAWLVVAVLGLSMVWSVIAPGAIVTTPNKPDGALPGVVNPVGIDGLSSMADAISASLLGLGFLVGLSPLVVTAVGWRRSSGARRRQFRWVTLIQLAGLVTPAAVFALPGTVGPVVAVGSTLMMQVLFVVAILQWNAFEVDVVVRRSVLAASFLVVGLGSYALVASVVSTLVGVDGPIPSTLGAAVAIAVFGPASVWIQRSVNRLLYGRRDDPYRVVAELGRHLATAADPADGLRAIVAALTEQLRIPYAAITDASGAALASSGTPRTDDVPHAVELVHHGQRVGVLSVGHRRGDGALTTGEKQLLETLGRQVGAAVAASLLVESLLGAREHLVVARQDERRRIQRDLHDGLGPQLTAVTLKLDAARNHLATDGVETADELVGSAREALQDTVADVRRLVYSLGEPAVASLGLAAAVRDQVNQLTRSSGVSLGIEIDDLPPLPAATEEALYRIITEAVTNVVRHADATNCVVRVICNGEGLRAEVIDDGYGIADDAVPGVGSRSMQTRAAELGGTLHVGNCPTGGTMVRLHLPLHVSST